MTSTILVTGGSGYIGSHTCVELLNAGLKLDVDDHGQRLMTLAENYPERLQLII
jgi:UDP-glucose 4-epimerase